MLTDYFRLMLPPAATMLSLRCFIRLRLLIIFDAAIAVIMMLYYRFCRYYYAAAAFAMLSLFAFIFRV